MASISISGLAQRISLQIEAISSKAILRVAKAKKLLVDRIGKSWIDEIRKDLSGKPHFIGRRHLKNETENPFKRTGKLLQSLKFSSRLTIGKHSAMIRITNNFDRRMTRANGSGSYGDILNNSSNTYSGFKERAYNKLYDRIRSIL